MARNARGVPRGDAKPSRMDGNAKIRRDGRGGSSRGSRGGHSEHGSSPEYSAEEIEEIRKRKWGKRQEIPEFAPHQEEQGRRNLKSYRKGARIAEEKKRKAAAVTRKRNEERRKEIRRRRAARE